MANNHVFENASDATNATPQFNYQLEEDGSVAAVDEWSCDGTFFQTNPDLDYSVVRVSEKDGKRAEDSWGFLNLRHGATAGCRTESKHHSTSSGAL